MPKTNPSATTAAPAALPGEAVHTFGDMQIRARVTQDASGADVLEVGTWRRSPADVSPDAFHLTAAAVQLPLGYVNRLEAALARLVPPPALERLTPPAA